MSIRRTDIDKAILANPGMSNAEIAKSLHTTRAQVWRSRKRLETEGIAPTAEEPVPPAEKVKHDLKVNQLKTKGKDTSKKYKQAVQQIEELQTELDAALAVRQGAETFRITPHKSDGTSEATAVWLASDWHLEEIVTKAQTNGINEFNLAIAEERAKQYFQRAVHLTKLFAKDVDIKNVVVALLGDFITNYLHDDSADSTALGPVEAALFAKTVLISGIEFILKNTNYDLTVVCHSGNHGRMSRRVAWGNENMHSLEYFVYCTMAQWFENHTNKDWRGRVRFVIPEGAHSYLDVYGFTVRFLHGHDIKFYGGVGGLTIPANKSIAQWDKARKANFTCFGHFHQALDAASSQQGFLCNGSLIGYNAYALSIKASAEPPAQMMFLIDKKRGKTLVAPILFE